MAEIEKTFLPPRKESQNKDTPAKVAKSVIDEYDIIDSNESDTTQKPVSVSQMTPESPPSMDSAESVEGQTTSSKNISHSKRLSSSDRANTIDNEVLIQCPRVDCQEKIIFCVDASAEMDKMTFRSRSGDKHSPRNMTKKGLGIFLQSKQRISKKHEYALILLQDTATWVRDFTNNPRDIQVALDDIIDSTFCEACEMASVFDKVVERVDIPKVEGDPTLLPPPYIIRLIFIYGRSNCVLQLEKTENFQLLSSSPYVFLDAVYLHEPPSEENQCQQVFDSLCDLDHKGVSYIMGACKNPTKFYDSIAQLLAHPLQRPLQNDTAYRIGSSIPENG